MVRYFVLLCLISLNLQAKEPSHYYVEIKTENKKQINSLAKIFHIDQIIGNTVYSVINQADYTALMKKFPSLVKKSYVYSHKKALSSDEYEFPSGDEKFHTYDEVNNKLKKLSKNYPNLVTLFKFGKSYEGRDILGIKITKSNGKTFTPAILFIGTHHAREHLSTETPLLLAEKIINHTLTDKNFSKVIENREIYIVPMLNPDGAMYDIKGKNYKMWRKNRAPIANSRSLGVDLNRNYSFGWGTGGSSNRPSSDVYMGPKPFSEPETLAVKKFVEETENLRMLISFHTFSELILYPWGGKEDGIGGKDQKVYELISKKISKWNGYKPMQASDLYVASGDTCDWAYGKHDIFCLTFELSPKNMWSGGFYPGARIIDKVVDKNFQPALYLIDITDNPRKVLSPLSL